MTSYETAQDLAFEMFAMITTERESEVNEIAKSTPAVVPGMQGRVPEPEVGTVLVYRVMHSDGALSAATGLPVAERPTRSYHYASIRAGDGRWYTTGKHVAQGVDWHTLSGALISSGAEVHTATGWAVFEL